MANLVVDSSVAVKWFLAEPHSTEARRVLDGYQSGALSFIAPDLLNAELGNVLWKKCFAQGLSVADARAILNAFRALSFTFTPSADLLGDAFDIAAAHRRSVYDSLYLALGARERCRVVTADEKLVNAVGKAFTNLVWLPNWP